MCGTDLAYAATKAMRGTAIPSVCCYQSDGTDLAYGLQLAIRLAERQVACPPMLLRACYAMSGTDVAYAPTRFLRRHGVRSYGLAMRCPRMVPGDGRRSRAPPGAPPSVFGCDVPIYGCVTSVYGCTAAVYGRSAALYGCSTAICAGLGFACSVESAVTWL
eukprot:1847846-Rhodomonas_salina.1